MLILLQQDNPVLKNLQEIYFYHTIGGNYTVISNLCTFQYCCVYPNPNIISNFNGLGEYTILQFYPMVTPPLP